MVSIFHSWAAGVVSCFNTAISVLYKITAAANLSPFANTAFFPNYRSFCSAVLVHQDETNSRLGYPKTRRTIYDTANFYAFNICRSRHCLFLEQSIVFQAFFYFMVYGVGGGYHNVQMENQFASHT